MEKMAWVIPDGSPRRRIVMIFSISGFKYLNFRSKTSVIRFSLKKQRTADTICAITVAKATPATPICSPATNQRSRTILMTVATSRYTRADSESPSPLKIPQNML